MLICPQVTLIHSQVALANKELLPCVRQEAKEILLQKGVQLLLSTCKLPSGPAPLCPQPDGGPLIPSSVPGGASEPVHALLSIWRLCLSVDRAQALVPWDFHVMAAALSWLLLWTQCRWNLFVE